jgi:hypothetical protein
MKDLIIFDECHKVRSKVRLRRALCKWLRLMRRKKSLAR